MSDLLQIKAPSAPIRSSCSRSSHLTSECLFGEYFKVIEKKNGWVFGINQTDNYYGWIEISKTGIVSETTHIINVPRTMIYSKPNIKSNILFYLPICAYVKITSENDKWGQIQIDDPYPKFGYISKNHFVSKDHVDNDWTKYAKLLLNVPYNYGGRDSIGIDCSALLQLSTRFTGILLERDTKDQINSKYLSSVNNKKIDKGSIIFWKNHVAIALNKFQIIHANAHFMTTNIENFSDANKRIESSYGKILKIANIAIK